jgi:GMP synthase-like glutamine amidotransferase
VVALPGLADPPDETVAVKSTRSVLSAALDQGVPVLGLCLGAELLAEAAGAAAIACPPEYGYHRVELTAAAAIDPLFSGMPSQVDAFQAHGFAAQLPEGATALAHSAASLQVFRIGETAWGVQFHPEPTVEMIETWIGSIGPAMLRLGLGPNEVVAEARRRAPFWQGVAQTLAYRFADVARTRERTATSA